MNNSMTVSKNLQTNLQNPTYLGTLVSSYLKSLEEKGANQELLSNLKQSIILEIKKSNFLLETGYSNKRVETERFNALVLPSLTLTLNQHIFYAMATNSALDFLYDVPQFIAYAKNNKNMGEIFKTIGVQKLKQREYMNTNNAMNAAIMYGNDKFTDFFSKSYEAVASQGELKESVKIALNSSNKTFLSYFISSPAIIEGIKTAKGQNCAYFVYSQDMLEFLKENFNIYPKNLDDWFEKIIFKTMDGGKISSWKSLSSKSSESEINKEFITILDTAVQMGINVERYNIKKFTTVCAPPLWLLCTKKPELIEKVYPYLTPGVKDSLGSNFLFYIFNTLKKQAPDTKDIHILNTLEALVAKNEHLMEENNSTGVNLLTLLKSTIDKKTLKPSVRLEAFQRYCEKLAIGYESKKIMTLGKSGNYENEGSIVKKMKI